MTEHFVITDEFGTPRFDVRGRLSLSQRLSLCDQSGQELAEIRKHLMTTRHDIIVGGQRVAEVHHEGFFGEHYEVDSQFGRTPSTTSDARSMAAEACSAGSDRATRQACGGG